jgi:hypothetical protein
VSVKPLLFETLSSKQGLYFYIEAWLAEYLLDFLVRTRTFARLT